MSRSPKYPNCSLGSALEYASKAYEKLGQSSVDSETFFEAMGYGGRSGASMSTLAALRYYGLVEGRGEDVQLSDLFLKIYRPLDENEKKHSLVIAAKNPVLFAEMFDEYSPLPPEALLRSIAIRKYGFSEKGAKRFVSNLIDTEALANASVKKPESDSGGVEEKPTDTSAERDEYTPQVIPSISEASTQKASETLLFKLSKESSAEVRIFGEMNSNAIDRLIMHLKLTSEIYD